MKDINYYSYQELQEAAIAPEAAQEDVDALGEWFSRFGERYWNGECYDADGVTAWPIVEWDEERDQGDVVGYELR